MCAREEGKEKGRWSGGVERRELVMLMTVVTILKDTNDYCLPLQLQQCQSSIGRHHSTQGIQLHGHGVALHCQLKLALLKQHVALFERDEDYLFCLIPKAIYCTFSFSNKASCFLLSSSKTSSSSSSSLPEELWTSYSTSSHAFSYITRYKNWFV